MAPVTLAAGAAPAGSLAADQRGFTSVELMLTAAIVATILSMSVPMTTTALDEMRTSMAARYLERRIMNARMLAVKRSTSVALRFETVGRGVAFAEHLDGNGNGVRSAEIAADIDPQRAPRQSLHEQFPAVVLACAPTCPTSTVRITGDSDGIRVGSSRILTLGPDGTATSGTLYLHGRRGQHAVRVLGATGRTLLEIGYRGYVAHEFIPIRSAIRGLRQAISICDV